MKLVLHAGTLRNIFLKLGLASVGLNEPNLRTDFHRTYSQLTASNWRSIFEDFINRWHKVDAFYEEYLVRAYSARLLEKVYDLYVLDGKSADTLREEFSSLLDQEDSVTSFMKSSKDLIQLPKKRLPSLEESMDATMRRLDTMQELVRILGPGVNGVLMGGSMAYGPFLNVRSNLFSSDVDVVAVVDSSFYENQFNSLDIDNKYIHNEEWKSFLNRKRVFLELQRTGRADILSQRFTIKDQDHSVSVHFFPTEIFEALYITQLKSVDLSSDCQYAIKDYKNTKYEKKACQLRNFSGEQIDYFPACTEVEAGFIVNLPGGGVRDGRFFPGFYHQIIMPACRILLDNGGYANKKVKESVLLMKERVLIEKKRWSMVSFLKSHPRHPVFAPHKYEDWDV